MKFLKKISLLLAIILVIAASATLFAACGGPKQLATPKNITLNLTEKKVSFDKVENANKYSVKIFRDVSDGDDVQVAAATVDTNEMTFTASLGNDWNYYYAEVQALSANFEQYPASGKGKSENSRYNVLASPMFRVVKSPNWKNYLVLQLNPVQFNTVYKTTQAVPASFEINIYSGTTATGTPLLTKSVSGSVLSVTGSAGAYNAAGFTADIAGAFSGANAATGNRRITVLAKGGTAGGSDSVLTELTYNFTDRTDAEVINTSSGFTAVTGYTYSDAPNPGVNPAHIAPQFRVLKSPDWANGGKSVWLQLNPAQYSAIYTTSFIPTNLEVKIYAGAAATGTPVFTKTVAIGSLSVTGTSGAYSAAGFTVNISSAITTAGSNYTITTQAVNATESTAINSFTYDYTAHTRREVVTVAGTFTAITGYTYTDAPDYGTDPNPVTGVFDGFDLPFMLNGAEYHSAGATTPTRYDRLLIYADGTLRMIRSSSLNGSAMTTYLGTWTDEGDRVKCTWTISTGTDSRNANGTYYITRDGNLLTLLWNGTDGTGVVDSSYRHTPVLTCEAPGTALLPTDPKSNV